MIYKISNYVTYNKSMASSIADKCWWIDSIIEMKDRMGKRIIVKIKVCDFV